MALILLSIYGQIVFLILILSYICTSWIMVLVFDGNSEIVAHAHVRSNIYYLIFLSIRARAIRNNFLLAENTYYPLCVRNIFWVTILYTMHLIDSFGLLPIFCRFFNFWMIICIKSKLILNFDKNMLMLNVELCTLVCEFVFGMIASSMWMNKEILL